MHPVITQAIAAERAREFQAYAVAAGQTRRLRRVRRARRGRAFTAIRRVGRGLASPLAGPPLRGPRPA
jgi:hypothetical protein